jgi:hypothetical protein
MQKLQLSLPLVACEWSACFPSVAHRSGSVRGVQVPASCCEASYAGPELGSGISVHEGAGTSRLPVHEGLCDLVLCVYGVFMVFFLNGVCVSGSVIR